MVTRKKFPGIFFFFFWSEPSVCYSTCWVTWGTARQSNKVNQFPVITLHSQPGGWEVHPCLMFLLSLRSDFFFSALQSNAPVLRSCTVAWAWHTSQWSMLWKGTASCSGPLVSSSLPCVFIWQWQVKGHPSIIRSFQRAYSTPLPADRNVLKR